MRRSSLAALAAACLLPIAAYAQDTCKNRGELDQLYCDENGDLTADPPTDPKKQRNPSTLVFTYTPVEDPAVYENIFKPFTDHLAKCTGKRVVFYQVQSNAAEIEAMRSGTTARRRLLHRPDELRGEPRRRGAVRGQGRREGMAGLPAHRSS